MHTDLKTLDLFPVDLASVIHPSVSHAEAPALLTQHEHIGFELGWDHAHYGMAPPASYAQEPSPLRHGWLSGQAVFGARTLAPTAAVRQWLQLRLHAWLHGRHVELFQVTPQHLRQLTTTHCPVTRQALGGPANGAAHASIARVRHDAAYAAGNLTMMSTAAQVAKAAHGCASALDIARRLEAEALRGNPSTPRHNGLNAAQWSRIAVLCSYVEPVPHAQACELPMRVLPPNRLRLFNPVQALQAFISQQLLSPGWARRINDIEALLHSPAVRRAFRAFFQTLLPRVLEAGRPSDPMQARWAIEDAWGHARVMQRWVRFALLLSPAQCEALVSRATTQQLAPEGLRLEPLADDTATEGWCLSTRGYVPHGRAAAPRWSPRASRPATLH